jgi:hypothetical protein
MKHMKYVIKHNLTIVFGGFQWHKFTKTYEYPVD